MSRRRVLEGRLDNLHHILIRIWFVQHIDYLFSVGIIWFGPFLFCVWLKQLHEIISRIDKFSLKYHFEWIPSWEICQFPWPLIIYHFVCCLPLLVFVWHINKLEYAILIRQMTVGDKLESILLRGRSQIVPSVSLWLVDNFFSIFVETQLIIGLLLVKEVILCSSFYRIRY